MTGPMVWLWERGGADDAALLASLAPLGAAVGALLAVLPCFLFSMVLSPGGAGVADTWLARDHARAGRRFLRGMQHFVHFMTACLRLLAPPRHGLPPHARSAARSSAGRCRPPARSRRLGGRDALSPPLLVVLP